MVEHRPRHTACQMPPTYMAALVAVVDDVLGPPLANRHLHRVQHQFGAQVVRHRPADDLAAPGVEHDGEIEEPCHRRHISDVATHSWFGLVALKSRSTRSGAGRSSLFRRLLLGRRAEAGADQTRLTHQTAIRLRLCLSPRPRRSAWTRGAP